MSETLLHCPFCGGEAYETSPEQNGSIFWRITCQHCYARIAGTHRTMNREAWNTRAERTCQNLIEDTFEYPDFECSECHAACNANRNVPGGVFNYCPSCGAKVVEE